MHKEVDSRPDRQNGAVEMKDSSVVGQWPELGSWPKKKSGSWPDFGHDPSSGQWPGSFTHNTSNLMLRYGSRSYAFIRKEKEKNDF